VIVPVIKEKKVKEVASPLGAIYLYNKTLAGKPPS
jgi:hypothetical protein